MLGAPTGSRQPTSGPLFRIGIVLAALWLALPELQRVPRVGLAAVLIAAVILALQPRLFLLVLGGLAALALLRPRLRG